MIDIEALKSQITAVIDNPYGKPTDIIGFNKPLADALAPLISRKEICFFDEEIQSDNAYHYLAFSDMLAKTEIMIFTVELPEKYHQFLPNINKSVKIFIPKSLQNTVKALEKAGLSKNMLYCI